VRAEITFNGSESPAARYVGWTPVPAQVRLADATGATAPVTVQLHNSSNNVCFTNTLTNIKKNVAGQFKAKAP